MTDFMREQCLRCRSLMMGKTSPSDVALAEEALGPHTCESDRTKVMVWIAKDEAGEILGGLKSRHLQQTSRLTAQGWVRVSGSLGVHISEEDAAEAIGEICVRAHDARLTHCDTDSRPWPDAQGPWRLEIPLATLED